MEDFMNTAVINDSVEALSNDSIPIYVNIEHCRNIIGDACSQIKDVKTLENLGKCNKFLAKLSDKLHYNFPLNNLRKKKII